MPTVDRSIHIDAPPATVWEVLEDVRRLEDFSPSTTDVDAPERLTEVGQTFRQRVRLAGRSFESTWRVAEIDPRRRLVVEGSVLPGTHYSMAETLEPADDGTRLTLTMDYRLPLGPLGRLAGKLGAEARAVEEVEAVLAGVRDAATSAGFGRDGLDGAGRHHG